MFDLVIFDCDGVLVDSERISVRLERVALAELGWEMSEEELVERFLGRTHAHMVAEVQARLGRPLPPEMQQDWALRHRAVFEVELQPVDGVVEALDALTIPTCVASSGTHARMRFTLGVTGLWERFAGRIFSADDVGEGKPSPKLFLHAAAAMGVAPERCAVIEDSAAGLQAAHAAGMAAFAYTGGLMPAHRLAGPGTVPVHDLRDLPRLLEVEPQDSASTITRSAAS